MLFNILDFVFFQQKILIAVILDVTLFVTLLLLAFLGRWSRRLQSVAIFMLKKFVVALVAQLFAVSAHSTYLVERNKRRHESNVFGEIGQEPEMVFATGTNPNGAEQYEPDDDQAEQEHQEASGRNAQVVDSFAQRWRPQREQTDDNSTDHQQCAEYPVVHWDGIVDPDVRFVTVDKQLLWMHF